MRPLSCLNLCKSMLTTEINGKRNNFLEVYIQYYLVTSGNYTVLQWSINLSRASAPDARAAADLEPRDHCRKIMDLIFQRDSCSR